MAETPHVRDLRIDLFRGLALVMIFINHMPGTIWENFTSRNFGFSDGAEGFVLMSGIATGLAYGTVFLRGAPDWAQALRPWRRALTLWWVHVVVVLCILALFLATWHDPAVASMAEKRNIILVLQDPVFMVWPLALLGHQFAYADILPLYVVLMLAAPGLLALAVRWPRALMLGSLALWFFAGLFRIRFPTWPYDNGWFFNPMSWQVLFVAGILTGLAYRQGRRWLPIRRWALWLATGFVVMAAIWVQVPVVAAWGGHGLWMLHEYVGVPHVFTSFDKGYLFAPRLLHILALAYMLSALPALKGMAASPRVAWLVLLGRNSLPVFAVSTVLSYIGQVIKTMTPPSFVLDTALVVVGLVLLYLVARLREGQKRTQAKGQHAGKPALQGQ
ncbi:OpgC family protein [Pseudotabrizicola sp. L79]|uniref:OpgC family protein n=1 Tax=Pseudotabrizicola sp. L79 TaxID=3118402 RepID=UPI002F92787D